MPTKTWTCHHNGHEIKVENYWNFLLWGRERLFVDDKLADEQQGWGFLQPRFSITLLGKLKLGDGSVLDVKALIGQAKLGFSHDCKIWVDSETFKWEGFPVESDLPADYEIDYIRVWEKK